MKPSTSRPEHRPHRSASARRRPRDANEGCRLPPPSIPGRFLISRFIRSSPVLGPLVSDLRLIPPFVRAIHGRLGGVVFKTHGRKILLTRVPCFDGYVPTAAQRIQRDRMRAATAYAQRVYADPVAKALYTAAAKKLHRAPFRLAIADFLRPDSPAAAARMQACVPKTGGRKSEISGPKSAGVPRPASGRRSESGPGVPGARISVARRRPPPITTRIPLWPFRALVIAGDPTPPNPPSWPAPNLCPRPLRSPPSWWEPLPAAPPLTDPC